MALAYWMIQDDSPDKQAIARELDRSVRILAPLPASQSEVKPYLTAGYWYRMQGDGPRALTMLMRARDIDAADGAEFVRRNRAQGKSVSAPGSAQLYLELGRTHLLLSDPAKAIESLAHGRIVEPDAVFTEEIANAYRAAGNLKAVAVTLMEGLLLDPKQGSFASELVDLYLKTRPGSCAVRSGAGPPGIDLSCPLVREDFCSAARNVVRIHLGSGRRLPAAELATAAIRDFGCPADTITIQ
jgi:hypothetical protein